MATNTILGLGVGLFNAALGRTYLSELANAENSGMSLLQIADVLDGIPQFTIDVMGGKTTEQQVDQFLSHYGLTSTSGAAYTTAKGFVNNMLSSGKGFGAITVAANDYLLGNSVAADFASTAALLKNKIAVATAFSKTYSSESVATLQGVLAGVTADMDTAAEIEAYLTGIGFPPGVLLTEGTDIVTGHIFVAPRDFTPGGTDQVNSLNDDDVLTGTSATDDKLIFDFVQDDDTNDQDIVPTMTGIEIADVRFATDNNATLDLQDSTGFTHVNLFRIDDGNTVEIDNIQQATTNNLSINNSNASDSNVMFNYRGSALAGTTDVVNLALNNAQVQNVWVEEGLINPEQGFETVNISSAGGAANSMVELFAEDAQTLSISGDQDLSIFGIANIFSQDANGNDLVEGKATIGGLSHMAGSLTKIDASTLKGDLAINLNDVLHATKDGTSGTDVAVSVVGGEGNDTFWIGNGVDENDTIDGGTGGNLAILTGGTIDGEIKQTERLEIRTNTTTDVVIDTAKLPDLKGILVRNEGRDGTNEATNKPVDVFINNITKEVAETGIELVHGTTGNNHIDDLHVHTEITGDDIDSIVYKIVEGVNRDPRFNFTVEQTKNETFVVDTVEIVDSDSESNSVEMSADLPKDSLIIKGGEAGDFFNLDVDTAGGDVGDFIGGLVQDNLEVQQGLLGIDTDGSEVDLGVGKFINPFTNDQAGENVHEGALFDVGVLDTQVRQVAAVIDASESVANIVVRVSTNEESVDGAQSIKMGTGDDTVIFDQLNDSRAGLTISDTVSGGDGSDTLVIDGHSTKISLGASEWTNVSGFEELWLVGNGLDPLTITSTLIGQNSYNLTLTNDLIDANGSDILHIRNDNDLINDDTDEDDTGDTGVESAVTIDARTLNAQNHFSYNGEEGTSSTKDKFILADANVNGANRIDGGAVDNDDDTNSAANDDVLEVRNTATVTTGDLANIRNVGTIAGSNDQATEQTLVLQLNDTVIDALVDSYHKSSTTAVETLDVRLNDAADVTAVAGMGIDLDTSATTTKSAVNVALDAVVGGTDVFKIGFGLLDVTGFATGIDTIQLSVSRFGLTLDADDIGLVALTDTNADLTNIEIGVAAATTADTRIVIDTATGDIFYDADGTGAQSQVLIAQVNGVAAGDVFIVA